MMQKEPGFYRYGLKVVRFTNVEVLQSFEGVCGELLGLIEGDF